MDTDRKADIDRLRQLVDVAGSSAAVKTLWTAAGFDGGALPARESRSAEFQVWLTVLSAVAVTLAITAVVSIRDHRRIRKVRSERASDDPAALLARLKELGVSPEVAEVVKRELEALGSIPIRSNDSCHGDDSDGPGRRLVVALGLTPLHPGETDGL